ncbi:N-acetyltransferase family protein [Nisaea sp.]|uniref:GNAT family N-acetyltransferase n=1 Tax=Nisaea sp. TaxID=2024842 RepID=UPI003296D38F
MSGKVVSLRAMELGDGPQVLAIYQAGIDTGHATFEVKAPDWVAFNAKYLTECRLVAFNDGVVMGWVGLTPVSTRAVYRGVAEHSIYIAPEARGMGIGRKLLEALIEQSEQAGFWTLQTSIFPENEASIRLHEAYGFRIMGTRERIAKMTYGPMAGQWRDTTIMERRSAIAGC